MATKQRRNSLCRCGSGKKAKKCCQLERKKTVEIIQDLRRKAQTPERVATNEIRAAIGGSIDYQKPEEPAIAPPKWAAYVLLAFVVVPIVVSVFAFIVKG